MGEEEARGFWDTHEIPEEYIEKVGTVPEEEVPKFRPRTRPVAIRFDQDVLRRLKELARIKNKGYQTLAKEFVAERLYEEEERKGIIGWGAPT